MGLFGERGIVVCACVQSPYCVLAPTQTTQTTQTTAKPPSVLQGQSYHSPFRAKETGVPRGSEAAQGHRHRKQGISQACLAQSCCMEAKLFRYQPQTFRASHRVPKKTLKTLLTYHPRMGLGSFQIMIALPQVSCPCQHAWKGVLYTGCITSPTQMLNLW